MIKSGKLATKIKKKILIQVDKK